MQPQIFLSYASQDEGLGPLTDLRDALQRRGVNVWVDKEQLTTGDAVTRSIQSAIQACVACVFLQSNSSLQRAWCAAELGAFWGAGKPVLIYNSEKGSDIRTLIPPLADIVASDSLTAVAEAAKNVMERAATQDVQPDSGVFVERLEGIIAPVVEGIAKIQDRLADLVPFDENTVYGIRYKHFFAEKGIIAAHFIRDLAARLRTLREGGGGHKVRLILDAGTTIFPIFRLLMEHKDDPDWTKSIEIVTNNIPGLFVALRDGRADPSDLYAPLAYKMHVVGGQPTAAFWALLPTDPENELHRVLEGCNGSSDEYVTIGVTTGNYARDDGETLFVRGQQHRAFKEALMTHADVIYSLLPLGKMLPRRADALTEHLVPKELTEGDKRAEHEYKELKIHFDGKQEFVLITTQRVPGDTLYKHWVKVEQKLLDLQDNWQSKSDLRVRILTVPSDEFRIKTLSGGREDKEDELEMPHESHRSVIKKWFT